MDDAVADDDVEAERAPVLVFDGLDDAAANVVVICGRIGNFAGEACDRLQQIGARYDADDLVAAHHRQALDVVGLHRVDDLLQRRILGDGEGIAGHHVGDLAAVLLDVIGRGFAGAKQESEPAGRACAACRSRCGE